MRGARRLRVARGPALVQAGDGGAFGAVDLEREQVVAPHPRRPGRQDRADRAALQFDQGRGVVLDVDVVARAALVDPLGRRRRQRGDDAPHRPERVLDHVAPVRIHVEDEPAAVLPAVVPARPLAGHLGAVEHPPAELDAEADHAAEEIRRREPRQLLQSRQAELVLDRAVLEPARVHGAQQRQSLITDSATGFSE